MDTATRLLAQQRAFATCTVECSRCHQHITLANATFHQYAGIASPDVYCDPCTRVHEPAAARHPR